MVIFGAGASYDSSPTYPPGGTPPPPGMGDLSPYDDYYRPPLAKDLFADRPLFIQSLDQFPQCKSIVPRLRDPAVIRGQTSIETRLQEIEEEARTYHRGAQELAAVRCYLQSAISQCEMHWQATTRGITNYQTLLREIERTHIGDGPVCLVTFNYDTLLESALEQFGLRIGHMEHYTQNPSLFRIFKLHGSVNWGQEAEIHPPQNVNREHPPSVLRYMIENAAQLQVSDRFVLCERGRMGVVNNRPVFPAIAIPVERKRRFQCPRYMIEHLVEMLPLVTKIMIIGWRATEDNFLDLLGQHLRPGAYISIVAGNHSEAEKISARLDRALLTKPPSCSSERMGFTDFMRTRRAEQILAG